jgi:hypothetical protein
MKYMVPSVVRLIFRRNSLVKSILTRTLFLTSAVSLFSLNVFAQNVTYLDEGSKLATTGVETLSFRIPAQVKVNQTSPLIKLKTARGKLGRKNRGSTEKLTFTEIDLRKYVSGRIFADFKVSPGGCDAALVTAAAPTEDRRQLLEVARTGSGENVTAQIFALHSGHIRLLGKSVNKFYVSGFLIPVGMAAWYSKDCAGSYEITVYIKDATAGTAPSEQPCGDKEIRLTYNNQALNYHSYREQTRVCSTNTPGCTPDLVFSTMTSQVQYIVPDTTSTLRVTSCMTFDANIPGPFNKDPIRIVVNRNNYSVTNYTRRGHVFHPGKVTRSIVKKGDSIYVETFGEGNGRAPTANELGAPHYWRAVDSKLVNAVKLNSGRR